MKRKLVAALIVTATAICTPAAIAKAEAVDCSRLIMEGMALWQKGQLEEALEKYKAALAANPASKIARKDIAVTYVDMAVKAWADPQAAIKLLHQALLFDPEDPTTKGNLDLALGSVGKDPKSFDDRIALADQCLKDGDSAGAIVEYRAAESIKDDPSLKKKMDEAAAQCKDPILRSMLAGGTDKTDGSTKSKDGMVEGEQAGSQGASQSNAANSQQSDREVMPLDEARQYFLSLVNRDRAANGLKPVALDDMANCAAQRHADEMAEKIFNGHWHPDGSKPPQRYSQCGGLDYDMENSHGTAPQPGWKIGKDPVQLFSHAQIESEEDCYFNEKPPNDGHRRNILTAEHTHVGLGITRIKLVYSDTADADEQVTSAQEFVNKYGSYTASADELHKRQTYTLSGEVDPSLSVHSMQVRREDLPEPIPLEELQSPAYAKGYTNPDELVLTVFPPAFSYTPQASLHVDGHQFRCDITPAENWKRGLYYFILFSKPDNGAHPFPISMRVLKLQ